MSEVGTVVGLKLICRQLWADKIDGDNQKRQYRYDKVLSHCVDVVLSANEEEEEEEESELNFNLRETFKKGRVYDNITQPTSMHMKR